MIHKIIAVVLLLVNGPVFCQDQSYLKLDVVKTEQLSGFPSCSAVNFKDDKLYLTGDDATHIYVLNKNYSAVDSITLSNYSGKRIPKKIKPDFEASGIISLDEKPYLLLLGSAATMQRQVVRLIPFENKPDIDHDSTINTGTFANTLRLKIGEVNLEGIAVVKNNYVLSNRANSRHPLNYLIVTSGPFWTDKGSDSMHIVEVHIPVKTENVIGISDLCYDETSDRMLISFTTELTSSAYKDGRIGDSYLGYIQNFSTQLLNAHVTIDQILNLSQVDSRFQKQKIEGVCIERKTKGQYLLHLTSDDDKGGSAIFNVRMRF